MTQRDTSLKFNLATANERGGDGSGDRPCRSQRSSRQIWAGHGSVITRMAASPPFPSSFGPATALMGSQGPQGAPGAHGYPCCPGRRVLAQDGPEVSLPSVTMGSPEASGGATDLRSWNAREITALCHALREDGSAWGRRRKGGGRGETLGRLPGGGPWAGETDGVFTVHVCRQAAASGSREDAGFFLLLLCPRHADFEGLLISGRVLERVASALVPLSHHVPTRDPAYRTRRARADR